LAGSIPEPVFLFLKLTENKENMFLNRLEQCMIEAIKTDGIGNFFTKRRGSP
jgi:hypothetical protein